MSITGPFAWKKTSRSERALSLSFRWFPSPHRSLQLLSMHKLLIVDDETGIRESLEGVLADEGYETASTESGEECLKLLRREHKPQRVAIGTSASRHHQLDEPEINSRKEQ